MEFRLKPKHNRNFPKIEFSPKSTKNFIKIWQKQFISSKCYNKIFNNIKFL